MSPQGVGTVLAEYGIKRPAVFASKALSLAERNYAQLERDYLYAPKFELTNDQVLLTMIFGKTKSLSTATAARLQRRAKLLSAYEYTVKTLYLDYRYQIKTE